MNHGPFSMAFSHWLLNLLTLSTWNTESARAIRTKSHFGSMVLNSSLCLELQNPDVIRVSRGTKFSISHTVFKPMQLSQENGSVKEEDSAQTRVVHYLKFHGWILIMFTIIRIYSESQRFRDYTVFSKFQYMSCFRKSSGAWALWRIVWQIALWFRLLISSR